MGELDQVFENFNKKNREYNKEEWIEFKKQEKQDVYALIDATAEKIISDGQEFKKYLDTQSKFEQYSVGNTLLVTAQMPEATMLRDYESWIKQITNNVNIPNGDWGKSYTYLAFDNEKLVGLLSIRYDLTNELAEKFGHIGYGVRPSERCKGYATKMLNYAL